MQGAALPAGAVKEMSRSEGHLKSAASFVTRERCTSWTKRVNRTPL